MPIAPDDLDLDQYITVHSDVRPKPSLDTEDVVPPDVMHAIMASNMNRKHHGVMMRVVALALPYVYCQPVLPNHENPGPVVLDVRDVKLMAIDPVMIDRLRDSMPVVKKRGHPDDKAPVFPFAEKSD